MVLLSDLVSCALPVPWCGGCIPDPPEFICPSTGRFPHAKNCTTFYECFDKGNGACECWCRENMIYDRNSSVCIYVRHGTNQSNVNQKCYNQLETPRPRRLPNLTRSDLMKKSEEPDTKNKQGSVCTKRNMVSRDTSKIKWFKTIMSYEFALTGKHVSESENEVVHDKTFIPLWILALLVYLFVIIFVAIALYFYD